MISEIRIYFCMTNNFLLDLEVLAQKGGEKIIETIHTAFVIELEE